MKYLLTSLLSILLFTNSFAQEFQWVHQYSFCNASRIKTDNSGHVYVLTYNNIKKIDTSGTLIWSKTLYPFAGGIYDFDIFQDTSIILGGEFDRTASNNYASDFDPEPNVTYFLTPISQYPIRDLFILNLDSSGAFKWVKQMGDISSQVSNNVNLITAVKYDRLGNILLSGTSNDTLDFDPGANVVYQDVFGRFIEKLTQNGEFIWVKGVATERDGDIYTDQQNNILLTGSFHSDADFDPGNGVYNLYDESGAIYILKLNPDGDFIWAKQLGDSATYLTLIERGHGSAIDSSGNIFLRASGSADYDPGTGIFTLDGADGGVLVKLQSNGDLVWAKQIKAGVYSIATDKVGNLYAYGLFF